MDSGPYGKEKVTAKSLNHINMPVVKYLKGCLSFSKLLLVAFLTASCMLAHAQSVKYKPKKHVIIGYVGGYRGLVDTAMVNANKLTIVNYAFVDVKDNRAWLTNLKTDTINFRYLVALRKKNPGLKVVISIGGWSWSKHFSDAVLSDTSRAAFAASAVAIVRQYNLDGIDIDWEYPAQIGDGNTFRPEDKQNYTLMFQALRQQLDILGKETGKKMLLTAAVGGSKDFVEHTEMDKAAQYLDYVNLMTYDFSEGNKLAVHHTNLYASKKYKNQDYADNTVAFFEAAGVPAAKLVMGVAFYGHSATVADAKNYGLGSKVADGRRIHGGGYTFIKDSLVNQNGFKYYRDRHAKAPYLFNATTMQFISYDDEWSVKKKCQYVNHKNLGGVMFWEYASDKKEYLLDEINHDLK
jgi:chitinase